MAILISVGANIDSYFGSPQESISQLDSELAKNDIDIKKHARLYETPAWPDPSDPVFVNTCLEIDTDLSAHDLMKTLLQIEKTYGRVRSQKNAPRPIDLDILDYHGEIIEDDMLSLPHPRLHERGFVLIPMQDIAPNWKHPKSHNDIAHIIADLPEDRLKDIKPITPDNHPFSIGPVLMGILNTTPDSFHDGGKHNDIDRAVNHARKMIEQGANIIDVGGESTRPGAETISIEEEIKRTVPIISILADEARDKGVRISIDTRNAETMSAAIEAGATMINDVSALTNDPESMNVARHFDGQICLMHMQGSPQTMQKNPEYDDVISNIKSYLNERLIDCLSNGIKPSQLCIDPGIGFGKTLDQNLSILKNWDHFGKLGVPTLLGVSRKSMIEKICGKTPTDDRLPGSLSATLIACINGAQIIRTHDVQETKQALDVAHAIMGSND